MVKHTFLDKCCTIFKGSKLNTGLNPVAELNYGDNISRILIHFDIEELQKLYNDKTFYDLKYLKHVLKMTNCGSVNNDIHNEKLFSDTCQRKERASSFDVILFKVPKEWDNGKGVDFLGDFWTTNNHIYSDAGCTWYQRINGGLWDEEGIYSSEKLSHEYDKFSAGDESVIIARQHFDIGNENFEFDITDYVNDLILNKDKNYGLCLCFSPLLEMSFTEKDQYVGFFGPYTNTFFHPYLESMYSHPIKDDRDNIRTGKTNRIYLYCKDGDEYLNLDNIPTCEIEGFNNNLIVKQHTKGVYYAEFSLKKGEVENDTILYDKWSNLVLNGEKLEGQEFDFVVSEENNLFSNKTASKSEYIPSLTGIIPDEMLQVGEIRVVDVIWRKKYTTNIIKNLENSYFRLYVKDGLKEINVIDYHPINKLYLNSQFVIDTNDFIPNDYFIDIKLGNTYYKDVLRFTVLSNIDKKYI